MSKVSKRYQIPGLEIKTKDSRRHYANPIQHRRFSSLHQSDKPSIPKHRDLSQTTKLLSLKCAWSIDTPKLVDPVSEGILVAGSKCSMSGLRLYRNLCLGAVILGWLSGGKFNLRSLELSTMTLSISDSIHGSHSKSWTPIHTTVSVSRVVLSRRLVAGA